MSAASSVAYPTRFEIASSVGRGGANRAEDVVIVQTMLTEAAEYPGERGLDPQGIDGDCGSGTISAVRTFQSRFTRNPDGRIDPGGKSIENLRRVTFHDGGQCTASSPTAAELVRVLVPRIGDLYVFGAAVPKDHPNWIGPWDCAEFVAWGIYQVSGRVVGCRRGRAPNGKNYDNGYTGYFAQDLPNVATQIDEHEAASLVGAIALRNPGSAVGHIAVSRGANRTIEAHSTNRGVVSDQINGRTWTSFWKLNFLTYQPLCTYE